MADLIHAPAAQLWRKTLRASDRILVIGATGWFGRTALALLDGLPQPRLLIASSSREVSFASITASVGQWDLDTVKSFAPTVIIDCAFLTRELVGSMSLHAYIERNSALTEQMLAAAATDEVERVITFSSGAAVYPNDALGHPIEENPYGHLKREAEIALADLAAERQFSTVVARAWSVSGAFVTKPTRYALSDMILQAESGRIHITASTPVFRRYTSVEDLLTVSLASAVDPGSRTIDSGGQLVEMQELADAIIAVVNPEATSTRAPLEPGPANEYFSSSESWNAASATLQFEPATLGTQIATTLAGLRSSASSSG